MVFECAHGRRFGDCFVCMMAVAAVQPICAECGNDLAAEDSEFCLECLEKD